MDVRDSNMELWLAVVSSSIAIAALRTPSNPGRTTYIVITPIGRLAEGSEKLSMNQMKALITFQTPRTLES